MPHIDLGIIITAHNNATGGLRRATDDVRGLGFAATATANRLKAIDLVIGGIILEKTLEWTRKLVDAAAATQNVQLRMAAWTGSMQGAGSILSKFNEQLGGAGFKVDALGDAFIKLRASGLGDDQAFKTVVNLANGIAALGGGDIEGKLAAAATAFQRFSSKGVVSMREFNSIVSDTGITVKEMAAAAGLGVNQFYEKLRHSTLGAKDLLDAFNKAAEQKFGQFGSLLNNTISGSLSKFRNDFSEALGGVGGGAAGAHLIAFVQNLDKAIMDIIATIQPGDIEAFFKFLESMAPIINALGAAVYDVARAVVAAAQVTVAFLSLLPQDAIEYGIIGYVLLGKKGALLGILIGQIMNMLPKAGEAAEGAASAYNRAASAAQARGTSLFQATREMYAQQFGPGMFADIAAGSAYLQGSFFSELVSEAHTASPAIKDLGTDIQAFWDKYVKGAQSGQNQSWFGSPERIKQITEAWSKLSASLRNSPGLTPTPVLNDKSGQLARLRQEITDTIASVADRDKLLVFQNAGDEIGAKIQQIANSSAQWVRQLEDAHVKLANSKLPLEVRRTLTAQIEQLEAKIVVDTGNAIAKAKILNDLKQQGLAIAQDQVRAQLNLTKYELDYQAHLTASPRFAIESGTTMGGIQNQIDQQRLQYKQTLLGYEHAIIEARIEQNNISSSDPLYDNIQKSIDAYSVLIGKTQEAMQGLNANAQLQIQFYKDLGGVLENDVAAGISGIIQGTMTWREAAYKLFSDLVTLAIQYIVKLLIIKGIEAALGGFEDGGVFPGGVKTKGFANGGVFPGGITPFANGGLITGPTLFGLAGEAGTEAIMPLTRIGGKLGVRAEGGGGNHYNITVQAIDTQSGMQFVAQQIANIDAGLRHRQNLNGK